MQYVFHGIDVFDKCLTRPVWQKISKDIYFCNKFEKIKADKELLDHKVDAFKIHLGEMICYALADGWRIIWDFAHLLENILMFFLMFSFLIEIMFIFLPFASSIFFE